MAKKIMSKGGGVGESRMFAADPSEFSPDPVSDVPPQEAWTIGGQPIPPELAHQIPYANTDQGIAEREARSHARVEITRDSSRGLERKRDFLQDHGDFEHAPDEMRRIMAENVAEGFVGRFLSQEVCKRRGTRGWDPVIDPETGDPVKFGTMILGQRPREDSERLRRRNIAKHRERLETQQQEVAAEQERLMREGLGLPLSNGGLQDDIPQFVERGD